MVGDKVTDSGTLVQADQKTFTSKFDFIALTQPLQYINDDGSTTDLPDAQGVFGLGFGNSFVPGVNPAIKSE